MGVGLRSNVMLLVEGIHPHAFTVSHATCRFLLCLILLLTRLLPHSMFQLGMISQSLLVSRLLKPLTPVVRHYGTMEVRRPKKRKRELAPSVRTMPCTVVDLPLDSQLRELCKDPDYAAKTFAEHPPRPDGVIGVHFHSLLSSTVLVYIHDTKGLVYISTVVVYTSTVLVLVATRFNLICYWLGDIHDTKNYLDNLCFSQDTTAIAIQASMGACSCIFMIL